MNDIAFKIEQSKKSNELDFNFQFTGFKPNAEQYSQMWRAIASVTSLQKLLFFCNYHLPKEMFQLASLTELDLTGNCHIEDIPAEIHQLKNLRVLKLVGVYMIKDLPREIAYLKNLHELDLSRTILRTLPRSVCTITSLKTLILSYANITQLPQQIGALVNLEFLDLSYNHLVFLPSQIGGLVQLRTLNIEHNSKLSSLPINFGNLWRLQHFCYDNTELRREWWYYGKLHYSMQRIIKEYRIRYLYVYFALALGCGQPVTQTMIRSLSMAFFVCEN